MSNKKTVSIIVLCFSNSRFLFEMLQSIFQQTYTQIQLIISDDGSDDFCVQDVKSFCDQYGRENVISVSINQNKKNLGTVAHLEQMLPLCTGDIIWTLAADDIIHDGNVVSRFVDEFERNSDILILSSQVELYDETLEYCKGLFLSAKYIELFKSGTSMQQFAELACKCVIPAVGTCYKKELVNFNEKLGETFFLVEDWPFYVRLVRNGIAIRYVDMVSVCHRHGGVSHGNNRGYNKSDIATKYSRDLLSTYKAEIEPYLGVLAIQKRAKAKLRAMARFMHHCFSAKYYIPNRRRR